MNLLEEEIEIEEESEDDDDSRPLPRSSSISSSSGATLIFDDAPDLAVHWRERIPGVAWLADKIRSVAERRSARGIPLGLLSLIPIALLIDLFDPVDFLGGPIGIAAGYIVESGFLLGVTGKPTYALGLSLIDQIPVIDLVPLATITLILEIARKWRIGPPAPAFAGPIIDV